MDRLTEEKRGLKTRSKWVVCQGFSENIKSLLISCNYKESKRSNSNGMENTRQVLLVKNSVR